MTVVNRSVVILAGSLREITISIIGDSNNFAVEVASGSWCESLLIPRATGFLVGWPIGAVGGTTVGLIMGYSLREKYGKRSVKQ